MADDYLAEPRPGRARLEELRRSARDGGQWYDCDETGGMVMLEFDGCYSAFEYRFQDIRTASAYFLSGLATYESGYDAGLLNPGWASWIDGIVVAVQDEPNGTHSVETASCPALLPDDFDSLDATDKADAIARLAAAIEHIRSGQAEIASRYVEGGNAYRA